MDISKLIKIKESWNIFKSNHPKFDPFIGAVKRRGIQQDSVINISIDYSDGTTIKTNIRIKDSDIQLIETLTSL